MRDAEAFADNLARLAVIGEAELPLPRDLARWACAVIRDSADHAARMVAQHRHIAAAGALVGGSERARARLLAAEGARLARSRRGIPAPGSVSWHLVQAVQSLAPLPGERSIRRILAKHRGPADGVPLAHRSP